MKYTNSEIKARLIMIVGITLSLTFVMSTASLIYGLLFVVQPIDKVSPNDDSAWALLSPMMLFLTGALSGILASNGLKDKEHKDDLSNNNSHLNKSENSFGSDQ